MVWSALCKLLQKQTYDVLSHRYGTYLLTGGIILVIVSGFQFGEVALEWSQEKYAAVFNSFSDNLSGKSYQARLCLPVPIDVVYTWVNGSDPKLLAELRRFKAEMEMELNETSNTQCPFPHCLLSLAVIADPSLPIDIDKEKLMAANQVLSRAVRNAELHWPNEDKNMTVFYFNESEDAKAATEETVHIEGHNFTFHAAYYTSDWTLANAVLLPDTILMTGFPHSLTAEQLLEKLPEKFRKANIKMRLYESEGLAVIEVPVSSDTDDLLHTTNFTIDGKEPTLNSASLIWDMQDVRYNEEIAASRFADNEELRYSLRSIETFAPWVRHIYLVTNGQIPAWLNLDNPRLTVVTHQELFVNGSHLPAFASPAIESHLHRIRGLSDKFIYMNDDVMFGKEVWPDDFFTHAHGQKVYLTWPVPNCQDGCPASWIRDGYCDKACNNSECEWDGGDCAGGAPNTYHDNGVGPMGEWNSNNDAMYCSSGCANNWVADRYCDQACNVKECGYDAGDCGVVNFDKMTRIDLMHDEVNYIAPKGETVLYVNVTAFFGESVTLEEGTYDEDPALRTATLAQKYKTLTVILYENQNATVLKFYIKGKLNETEIEFSFNLTVDSIPEKPNTELIEIKGQEEESKGHQNETGIEDSTLHSKTTEKFAFEDIPKELQNPKVAKAGDGQGSLGVVPTDLSEYTLDDDTRSAWKQLQEEVDQGDITNNGFEIMKAALWTKFSKRLQAEGKQPVKAPLKTLQNVDGHINTDFVKQETLGQVGQKVESEYMERVGPEKKTAETTDKKFDQYLQSKQSNRSKKETPDANGPNHQLLMKKDLPAQVLKSNQHPANVAGLQPPGWPDDMYKNRGPAGQVKQMSQGGHFYKGPGGLPGGDRMEKVIVQRMTEIKKMAVNFIEESKMTEADSQIDNKHKGDNDKNKEALHRSRKLNSLDFNLDVEAAPSDLGFYGDQGSRPGFLPWEKQNVFAYLQKKQERLMKQKTYVGSDGSQRRKLLDTFGDSLRHVNRLYNTAYGHSARKVPAHMPHFIDRNAMYELQNKFPQEWDETSSHQIRSSTDMQYAFSYMYYIIGEPQPTTVGDIFDELDNDKSGVLSDRELRTMATRLYELPLDLQTLSGLEQMLINCSKHLPVLATLTLGWGSETYYEKAMPQVTKILVNNCNPVIDLIQKNFKGRTKYKHEIVDDSEIAFKMIQTNVSQVVGQLDDIRRNPKKFICLNDNIDHGKEDAKTVKAVLLDFYESILPNPSEFELAREYRNRFLHTDELREWRKYRDWLKLWTQIALGVLILFTIGSFFADKFSAVRRRFFRPRAPSPYDDQHSHQAPKEGQDVDSANRDSQAGAVDQSGGRPPDMVDV